MANILIDENVVFHIKNFCKNNNTCNYCPFHGSDGKCKIWTHAAPANWDIKKMRKESCNGDYWSLCQNCKRRMRDDRG